MVHLTDEENFFWGLTLENEKRYSQVVASSFHVSMAALEPAQGKHKDDHVCVMLQQGESEFLLCTLSHSKTLQQPLDLNFRQDEEIAFFLNGKGRVHLTGYIVPEDVTEYQSSDDEEEDSSVEEVSSDDDIPTLQAIDEDSESDSDDESSGGKRKKKQSDKGLKKKLMMDEADEDDDDDSDDEDFDMDLSELLHGDLSEEDSDDDSAEDTEGSFIAKPDKKSKQEQEDETPSKKKKNKKKKKAQEQPETPKSAKEESSDAGTPNSEKKKKKKKKKNKNKENGDAAQNQNAGSTPGKGLTQPGKSPQDKGKSPQPGLTPGSGQKTKGKKQALQGGVIVEDIKEGHGQPATPGKMAGVYYTGKLLSNNKEFDSSKSGPPFKFSLGKGEVIKGWDVGVRGMKVGGKRKITVPAKMGYGNQRQGPIPANSTLVFDVELKSVS